jgi:hypothetical protein
MKTRNKLQSWFLLLPLALLCGTVANAGEPGAMDIPYTPPIKMMQTGHEAGQPAVRDLYGRVLETMNSGGYTYVRLDTGEEKVWAAGPITPVKKGDAVKVRTDMPMRHFHSKSLKRDFDLVYFSNTIVVAGKNKTKTAMDPHQGMTQQGGETPAVKVKKAKNGKTIIEIYNKRKQLAGKRVRVRGKVIKYIGNIYGKNWIHIQDGSSKKSLLVITSDKNHADVILVEGTVVLNKDNGIGHVYPVVLDDAKVIGS